MNAKRFSGKENARAGMEESRRKAGQLYLASALHDDDWIRRKLELEQFNQMGIRDMAGAGTCLGNIVASCGPGSMIIPPFYVSQGKNTYIGSYFFANAGFTILDEGDVRIGDHVYLGPGVFIFTPSHPIDVQVRNSGLQYARGVTIEDNVWIGGNVTINPGVTIGEGTVIGSGSVVTESIEPGVIAAGNPCRVIRRITEEDKAYWADQYNCYCAEINETEKSR